MSPIPASALRHVQVAVQEKLSHLSGNRQIQEEVEEQLNMVTQELTSKVPAHVSFLFVSFLLLVLHPSLSL